MTGRLKDLVDESGNNIILHETDIGKVVMDINVVEKWIVESVDNVYTRKWREEERI